MSWALDCELVAGSEWMTLIMLADHADDQGYCWPSMSSLAKRVRVSRNTINRNLNLLRDKGLLAWESRTRKDGGTGSNRYQLLMTPCNKVIHPLSRPDVTPPCNTQALHATESSIRTVIGTNPVVPTGMDAVREVFTFWQETLSKTRSKLDDNRTKRIKKALTNFSVDDLKLAIIGITYSDWHMGAHKDNAKPYNDISNVFKDAAQIEKFIVLGEQHQKPSPLASKTTKTTKRKTLK